jgi:hypothetical protein
MIAKKHFFIIYIKEGNPMCSIYERLKCPHFHLKCRAGENFSGEQGGLE